MRTPLLIDTDCGIDDAVALWWAALSPDVELTACTAVHGNVDVDTAAVNTCRILEATGNRSVPVAVGAAAAWGPAPALSRADFIHGADGIANLGWPPPSMTASSESAVALMRRVVDDRPGEITVVTLGPVTNIAAVVDADPTWATRVKRLVVMGGAAAAPGNAMPAGEANIAHDPVAAQVALSAAWNEPPLLVGLDITYLATLSPDEIALAREGRTAAAVYLAEMLAYYARFGGTFTGHVDFPCHDALAVMLAVHPDRTTSRVLPTAVETGTGPAQGMTVVDRRQPFFAAAGQSQFLPDGFSPVDVPHEVDAAWFRAEIRRMFGD